MMMTECAVRRPWSGEAAGGDARAATGRMKIGILGQLSTERDTRTVTIGAAKQRTLLGLLALRAGHPVSRDEIVDLLWGSRPPASHSNLVHTYIARLRRALKPEAARPVIEVTGTGYRLRVGADELDLLAFEELRRSAAARRAEEPREAMEHLEAALRLWRGPVLADSADRLRRHPAAAEPARHRLTAALDYADLALELGRPERAVAELRPLADDEPLHEGLVAKLMLGLAASGQQAAALQTYVQARATLRDELGIEPGAELRQAQLRILRRGQERVIDTVGAPVPAQLPADLPGFAGREQDLAALDALQAAGGTVLVLTGPPGSGKTSLAVRWARRIGGRFPDGQLYLDLRGYARQPALDPLEALSRLLGGLGERGADIPSTVDEAAGRYRTLLSRRKVLIVLDNAADAGQLRPLLPGNPACMVVATSRDQLDGSVARDGARRHLVDVLDPAGSQAVLRERLGERLDDEPASAIGDLIALCGGLPLALSIAATRLHAEAETRLADYIARLRAGDRLREWEISGDDETAVGAAFDLSYAALAEPEQRLFRLLGSMPGRDLTAEECVARTGGPHVETVACLRRLASANLIRQLGPGRYAVHGLLRLYAAERFIQEEALGR